MDVLFILLVILFMGFVPMLVYTTLLWWIDHWEREPWYLIAAAFLWGAIPSIILALISQVTIRAGLSATVFYEMENSGSSQQIVMAVLVAPLTEETIKAVALLIGFLFLRKHINTLLDGLIYGAAVGFGFAAVENIFYFSTVVLQNGVEAMAVNMFFRAFIFGLNHAYFTGMTGLGFALARFRKSWFLRFACPLFGLMLAMTLHALHNLFATLAEDPEFGLLGLLLAVLVHAFGIFGVFLLVIVSLVTQKGRVRHYLQEEVVAGVLTADQAIVAGSTLQRITVRKVERRLNRLCSKLALMKHTYAIVGHEGANANSMLEIRAEIMELSSQLCSEQKLAREQGPVTLPATKGRRGSG